MARESKADIIGYGGQAGGGKTDLLVGTALTEHHRAMIFRRDYGQLRDIVRRAKEVTEGYRSGFNGQDLVLTLPGGATLEFGAMNLPDDWQKYKGRAKDLMGFDEVTEFLEIQVRSVIGWVRSTRPGQRRRVIFTFNPPTDVEGEWIIDFFAPWLREDHPNPAMPGELRWYAMIDGEEKEVKSGEPFEHTTPDGTVETIYPISRTFIPAKLADNKHLARDGEYRRVLQSLPEPLRSQLLYGKFNVAKTANPWQIIPTAWVQLAQKRWVERGGAKYQPEVRLTVLGVDPVHGGKDKLVIAPRYGDWVDELVKYPGSEIPDGKTLAAKTILEWEPGADINLDAIGYGASGAEKLSDSPEDGGYGIPSAYSVNVSNKSTFTDKSGKFKMRNMRAEMYWRLREELDPDNNPTLCLPPDRELLADLCAPTFKITPQGIQVESKEDIKERLKRSPDCGDAVALTMLQVGGDWGEVAGMYGDFVSQSDAARRTDATGSDGFGDDFTAREPLQTITQPGTGWETSDAAAIDW